MRCRIACASLSLCKNHWDKKQFDGAKRVTYGVLGCFYLALNTISEVEVLLGVFQTTRDIHHRLCKPEGIDNHELDSFRYMIRVSEQ